MATWGKQFLQEFIELFKREENLWRVNSKDYHNKQKRDASYQILVDKVKEVEPQATRDMVTKKINNLRCSFRKELKKVRTAAWMAPDQVYRPKLWYYDMLLFLTDQDAGRTEQEEGSDDEDIAEKSESIEDSQPMLPLEKYTFKTDVNETSQEGQYLEQPNKSQKRRREEDGTIKECVHCKRRKSSENDDCSIFGKLIASQMRELSPRNKAIARNKIQNIIFELEMEELPSYSST